MAVVLVIAGLSTFFTYQSIINNRLLKEQLIKITVEETQLKLNGCYTSMLKDYYNAVNNLSQNPVIVEKISKNDTSGLSTLIDNLLSFRRNIKTELFIEYPNGGLFYGKKFFPGSYLYLSSHIDSVADQNKYSIILKDNALYQTVSSAISNNKGRVVLAINEFEGFKYLEEQSGVQLISVINNGGKTAINSYGEDLLSNSIPANFLDNKKESTRVFKHQDLYYSFQEVGIFSSTKGEKVGSLFTAIDITKFEAPYRKSLFRSILITILVITSIMIIVRIFFNKLLFSIFRLEESFEKEILNQTKEILDTNTELNQIFNSTANGIRIINKNYEIIRVNEAFTKISGLQKEIIEGEKCYNVFPGSYCHTTDCPLERIKEGELTIESEEVRFNKGGEKVRCSHTAVPFKGKDGELIGIIEDFKDITDKYNVQNTLKKTEQQFSSFMDSLPVGVFIKDKEGVLLYHNTYLRNTLGLDNYLGKNLSNELAASWANRIKEEDAKTLQLGKIDFEEVVIDKEGRERTFYTHKFRFEGVDNQWRIGGISIDITSRKEAEHHLYVLSKAVNNSPVSIVITNPQGEIEFSNPAFTRITGYSNNEALSKNLLSLKVEYNSGKNLIKAYENILKGDVWRGEVHMQNKNGEHFWVLGSFAPVLNRKGEVAHCVAIMEDITLRKENEKELILAKTRAEESDKLKTAFLSNLSHEIRTPLNAIIGFSSLITDSDLTYQEKKNLSEVVYKNSNDLLKLIEDLIEISEIETGQLNIKKSECSVNKILNELKAVFIEEDKKARGVKLNLRKEIGSDDFTILTDPVRLKQVLYNLISNACKFTEQGFVEFGYTFKDDQTLLFYIIDSGVGIELEKQKNIFSPFRQADDSNTRKYGGMGLGLAISKHIIEKLGGKIWFTTCPGSGSTFFFTIPHIPVRLKFEQTLVEEKSTTFNWKNKTILIADDIDVNYVFLKAAVKNTKAEVIWAKNGKEAVDFVQSNPRINIVLMDIIMPEMDGFEATRKIKEINSNLPVVCHTAYPSKENYQASLECGFNTYLAKPIKVQSMLQVIDKFISEN